MNLTAKHILVKGKVQGVFFRKNTRQIAEALDITGWVKNTDDGDVEIFAQGDESKIEQLLSWCKQGPPRADVKDVEIIDERPDISIKKFSVQH